MAIVARQIAGSSSPASGQGRESKQLERTEARYACGGSGDPVVIKPVGKRLNAERRTPHSVVAQSVHFNAGGRVGFSGEWASSHGESAGIYASDWRDVTSVCTSERYHEHSAGELAVLHAQTRYDTTLYYSRTDKGLGIT